MPRKNRKGRTRQQRPRRRYHPGRSRDRPPTAAAEPPPDTADEEPPREIGGAATCGTCREWDPGPDPWATGGRGTCGHPASGIAFPPPDMAACPFYTT